MSFLVLTISISHFGVSGQYIQYNANAKKGPPSLADRQIDTVTAAAAAADAQVEYEYYDDLIEDSSTTQLSPTTTTTSTTTTTTPKPITSYRYSTTHRNGFRPIQPFNKKKFEVATKQYQPDSYTEASNESAFVQKSQNPNQSKQLPPPQLRNAIADVNRRTVGKDYVQEKSVVTSSELNGGNGNGSFSRRYARFLFKLRSG